jgi:DNA (cytosine-5)-methyltransferase 1
LRYLSVCSGIEAATVAWHDLGWKPVGFSEIEKFPSQVLAHHYPDVPNLGDMTKYKEWDFGTDGFDILVGGTPCQSFSVAGLRKGLEDPRGNLMLTYVGILDHFRPKWCVWENVPGVLNSGGGRDFGSFLGALVELGYGFSYRVLDAKNFGVPQRRRRVFVVGHLGDWRPAAKVLFEPGSLCRDSKESASKGQRASAFFESSLAQYREGNVAGTLKASGGVLGGGSETFLTQKVYENHPADSRVKDMGDLCQTVTSRWGTGGGNVPLVEAVGFTQCDAARDTGIEISPTLRSGGNGGYPNHAVSYAIQGNMIGRQDHNGPQGDGINEEVSFTLNTIDRHAVSYQTKVRRLTPIECERLQGFPDNYTNIPWNGKAEAPDGHRYKALGNSMAVPVMQWIGDGIDML